jgi:hypothetical protein
MNVIGTSEMGTLVERELTNILDSRYAYHAV